MNRCLMQTHYGTIAPRWQVEPDGETAWTGYHGAPTDNEGHICDECLEDWHANYPRYFAPFITDEEAAEIEKGYAR